MSDKYGLIGNPLSHTKSPMIHGTFASDSKQYLTYTAIEAETDAFVATVDQFRAAGAVD
ncbi:hypothetical protein [Marinobacterium aestuariivivens]|uniref:Shikimate dehydrogenase substrate binding N-terminal domain-containing protein n=1 Tax=Marinobacterium aestuariivivens TaxID=1698799 RepID=A0ABW1ZZ83_9GAMM